MARHFVLKDGERIEVDPPTYSDGEWLSERVAGTPGYSTPPNETRSRTRSESAPPLTAKGQLALVFISLCCLAVGLLLLFGPRNWL